jgi:SAM-dependent methyltransferase
MHKNINIEIAKKPQASEIEIIKTPTNHVIRAERYENCAWPYVLSLPFMWLITIYVMIKKSVYKALGLKGPKINSLFFDGLGLESRKVKEYAATWRAMNIVYNHPYPYRKTLRGIVDDFYWYGINCQALRNRLKMIKDELRKTISKVKHDGEVRIISLACGSAEATIEIMAEYKKKGLLVRAILVDIDKEALKRAENLAIHFGIKDQIELQQKSIYEISDFSFGFNPHIIEMLGFLDYIKQEEAILLVKKIQQALKPGGFFLTCNISPNIEQYFLKWVINWPMIYRKPDELAELSTKTGFSNYRLIYEPMKIHGVLIAEK